MKVLGIIPARGGSKGVPRKNIRLLNGKPLLAYTAESAAQSRLLTRVILSTEDEEIAQVGRSLGLDVPFMRPSVLAEDTAPTLPVVQHALSEMEKAGEQYDAVCLLQPTNPLRRPEDIDGCIELLESSGADSVVSVLPVPHEYNPEWVYIRRHDRFLELSTGDTEPIARRQDLPSAFHRDGTIYVTRTKTIVEGNSLYGVTICGYEIDKVFSMNIDTESDWESAISRMANLSCETGK